MIKYPKEYHFVQKNLHVEDNGIMVRYWFDLQINEYEGIHLRCHCYRDHHSTLWVRCFKKEIKIDRFNNFYLAKILTNKLINYIIRKIHDCEIL